MRLLDGFGAAAADRLLAARARGPFQSVEAVQHRAGLTRAQVEALANADAFISLGLNRREALWAAKALTAEAPLPLFAKAADDLPLFRETAPMLPTAPQSEAVIEDYRSLGLSLKDHPLTFLRAAYRREGLLSAAEVASLPDGAPVTTAGLVLVRQRPGTAKGVVFLTLEDETGIVNAVVWADVMKTYRPVLMQSRLLLVRGKLQRSDTGAVPILHLVTAHLENRSDDLLALSGNGNTPASPGYRPVAHRHPRDVQIIPKSRDFH
ncbi:helix-hairpin-helix domain-containing protein [Elstera litoralis]